jgi:hypothetical protein
MRKKAKRKKTEIGDDLMITKTTRGGAGAGTWAIGTVAGHRFDGLVFPLHADQPSFEMDQSRISKLWIKRISDGQVVCNFDRGWDIRPRTKAARAIVAFLAARLADRIYPDA